MDVRTELKILTHGMIQRQREAALRRERARRRLRRQQLVRRVVRYAAGVATVGAAGFGVAKAVTTWGDLNEAKAKLARRSSRSDGTDHARTHNHTVTKDNVNAPV